MSGCYDMWCDIPFDSGISDLWWVLAVVALGFALISEL